MKRLVIPVVLGLALAMSACGKKEEGTAPQTSAGEVQKEVKEAVSAVADKARQERDEFVSKTQKEVDELNKQMAELRQKAEKATGEAKAKLDQQLQNLEQERQAAEQKLAELKAATGEKWQEFKAGVSDAIDRLKQSIRKVRDGSA